MSTVGRTAAALALVGALLMQGVATAMLTAPPPRVAQAVADVPVHIDRATEIPELTTSARERVPARERLSRVAPPPRARPRAASTDAADATVSQTHRARSHPAARGLRDHDPAPH